MEDPLLILELVRREDPDDGRRPAYRTIFTLLTRLAPVAYG